MQCELNESDDSDVDEQDEDKKKKPENIEWTQCPAQKTGWTCWECQADNKGFNYDDNVDCQTWSDLFDRY